MPERKQHQYFLCIIGIAWLNSTQHMRQFDIISHQTPIYSHALQCFSLGGAPTLVRAKPRAEPPSYGCRHETKLFVTQRLDQCNYCGQCLDEINRKLYWIDLNHCDWNHPTQSWLVISKVHWQLWLKCLFIIQLPSCQWVNTGSDHGLIQLGTSHNMSQQKSSLVGQCYQF